MIEIQFCLTAADKQKYGKKQKTWQLDQTNISITHIWKQDWEQTLVLWSLLAFLEKIWAINSDTIVWGFPIFSLATLSNKLISCGKLGTLLICHVFFSPPFQTHAHTHIVLSFPRGINQRQHCQVLRSFCMCISFYTWKWFIFVSVPLMLRHVFHFIRHQQTAEKLLAWQASGWLTLKIPKLTDWLSLSLFWFLSGLTFFWFHLSWETQRSVFFSWSLPHEIMGWVKNRLSSHI